MKICPDNPDLVELGKQRWEFSRKTSRLHYHRRYRNPHKSTLESTTNCNNWKGTYNCVNNGRYCYKKSLQSYVARTLPILLIS